MCIPEAEQTGNPAGFGASRPWLAQPNFNTCTTGVGYRGRLLPKHLLFELHMHSLKYYIVLSFPPCNYTADQIHGISNFQEEYVTQEAHPRLSFKTQIRGLCERLLIIYIKARPTGTAYCTFPWQQWAQLISKSPICQHISLHSINSSLQGIFWCNKTPKGLDPAEDGFSLWSREGRSTLGMQNIKGIPGCQEHLSHLK